MNQETVVDDHAEDGDDKDEGYDIDVPRGPCNCPCGQTMTSLTVEARFRSQLISRDICGEIVVLGQVILRVLRSSLSVSFH
jgi:hypothetical protein